MELTSDLINIQSILAKTKGELIKINYKGGNEDAILGITEEFRKFLKTQKYLTKDDKPNEAYSKQLEDIVLFLALNTRFKHPIELEEYSHLINITTPTSKCVFVNVVYGLDLCKYYCYVIEKFPLNFCPELLDEVLQCLKKSNPKIQIHNTNFILRSVATRLSAVEFSSKVEYDIDSVCEVVHQILLNHSGIYSNEIRNFDKDTIYNHMGNCLLSLFNVVLEYDIKNQSLKKFMVNIIKTCSFIVQNVTLDVYCAWAETEIDEEILQTLVSNKAYLFIEKFQKIPEASHLIGMLGSLARKPKSLTEQIYEADLVTKVRKIKKEDPDQVSWFRALLRSHNFDTAESLECVRTWSHICNEEDVLILINWCIQKKTEDSVNLFVKCCSNLSLDQLINVATKHFHQNKFVSLASTDVEKKLTNVLNKVKEEGQAQEILTKDILLLFLQQPEIVLSYIYDECLKNVIYVDFLLLTFSSIKEIIRINNLGINLIVKAIEKRISDDNNAKNYVGLFKKLLSISYFNNDDILLKILNTLLQKFYQQSLLSETDLVLQIMLGVSLTFALTEDTKDLLQLLLTIMYDHRCNFLEFQAIKHELTSNTVEIFRNLCKPSYNSEVEITLQNEEPFTRYYRLSLYSGGETSLFKTLCDQFDINQYGECMDSLLKVLPVAVNSEWIVISQSLIEICGTEKSLELLSDLIILISHLAESQSDEDDEIIFSALKYCVQKYGSVIQHNFLRNSTLENEIYVNTEVCRVLTQLPILIREEEGLFLVNALTDRSLKALATDKNFLCRIVLIKNSKVRKALARKIAE